MVAAFTRGSTASLLARRLLLIFLANAALSWTVTSAGASTDVAGTIASDTTWDLTGSPYVLTGDVTVAAGVTLALTPGVVVKANSKSRELIVLGMLEAEGTPADPIILTSYKDDTAGGDTNGDGSATAPAFGDWVGVGFYSNSPGSIGDFVEIRYAGYFGASAEATEVEARVRQKIDEAHAAVEAAPGDAQARGRYGMVLDAHSFPVEASAAYREAARLDPEVKRIGKFKE